MREEFFLNRMTQIIKKLKCLESGLCLTVTLRKYKTLIMEIYLLHDYIYSNWLYQLKIVKLNYLGRTQQVRHCFQKCIFDVTPRIFKRYFFMTFHGVEFLSEYLVSHLNLCVLIARYE